MCIQTATKIKAYQSQTIVSMARFQDYCMHVYAKALEKFAKDQSPVRHSLYVTISRQKSNKLKKIPQPNKLDIGQKEEELSCNPCLQKFGDNV